jgi:hypothetical protein
MFPWKQNFEDKDQAHNPFEVAGQGLPEDANVFTTSGEMALLTTVLNDKIDVNSKEFQTFIALENEPEMSTINFEDIRGIPSTSGLGSQASGFAVGIKEEPIEANSVFISNLAKQGRGRPRVPRTATTIVEPPRKPRGRPPTAQIVADVDSYDRDSSSAMSSSEQKEHRYKRMRQFNYGFKTITDFQSRPHGFKNHTNPSTYKTRMLQESILSDFENCIPRSKNMI